MPCRGPDEAECRVMEAYANLCKYGIRASDLDIATRVACELSKGNSTPLTTKWAREHAKLVREREEQEEADRRKTAADLEILEAKKTIYAKHGLHFDG